MEIQGKVIAVLEARSGVSARGEWKSQDYVIETHDAYPRKMVFGVFGADRISRFNIQLGQEVNVSFDIDAHEYNGRWFNNIRAFDVRQVDPARRCSRRSFRSGSCTARSTRSARSTACSTRSRAELRRRFALLSRRPRSNDISTKPTK